MSTEALAKLISEATRAEDRSEYILRDQGRHSERNLETNVRDLNLYEIIATTRTMPYVCLEKASLNLVRKGHIQGINTIPPLLPPTQAPIRLLRRLLSHLAKFSNPRLGKRRQSRFHQHPQDHSELARHIHNTECKHCAHAQRTMVHCFRPTTKILHNNCGSFNMHPAATFYIQALVDRLVLADQEQELEAEPTIVTILTLSRQLLAQDSCGDLCLTMGFLGDRCTFWRCVR